MLYPSGIPEFMIDHKMRTSLFIAQGYFELGQKELEHLRALLSDRSEGNLKKSRVKPCDFTRLVEEDFRFFKVYYLDRFFTLQKERDPIIIPGNERALKELIRVLIENATKYTPPQGRIDLRLKKESDRVILEVENTGPFLGKKGSGLGILIAQHVVEQHKGKMEVEKDKKRYAVRVELPHNPSKSIF